MSRARQLIVTVLLALVVACTSQPPPPSTIETPVPSAQASPISTSTPSPTASHELVPPSKSPGPLDLEACDPAGELPCAPQSVLLSRAIVGTGIALSLSTEWAQGRLDRPEWGARALGLGGWSVDVLQRYDHQNGVLLDGDGSWRIVAATELHDGERAVPSFDSQRVFVFDAAWRHVRTLDDITGATLLTFSYDAEGRLAGADGSLNSDPIHLRITRDATGRSTHLVGVAGADTLVSVDDNGDLVAIVPRTGTAMAITPGEWGLIKTSQNVGGRPTTVPERSACAASAHGGRVTLPDPLHHRRHAVPPFSNAEEMNDCR